jgi:hypothetical protein
MNDNPEKEKTENAMLLLFCIGFAAGAGVLPYSRAEKLVSSLAQPPEEEE